MNFLFIIFLTAISGTMIGLFFYKRQKARLDYFYDLCGLINVLILDVRFRQDRLHAVMTEYLSDCKSELKNHIELFLSNVGKGELNFSPNVLKKSELFRVNRFFLSLGRTDSGTQLLELDGYKMEFSQDLSKVKQRHDSYGTLFIKLGFALGLGVGILFV
ncbi:MAG: stage III sporulation protein AB [Clostridiales bacterium]|jgi:hypothetical protein|nr:stage III sporulation protein AB [Clostridiales bacterium]